MKKILTLFLSAVLIMSCLTVPAFSADAEYISAENMEVLRALGIVQNDVNADAKITRGEAAKYFCNILDLEIADPTGFESIFYDVTSETPYYKYISTICKAGYMQGDGNGRFRPNAPISTMEAARVLTSLIGYKGYIAVSSLETVIGKTDAIDGVPVVSEMTYGQFFRMVYNILHAPACRETGYGTTITYEISEDYIGTEYLYKIVKADGIVDGIRSTTIEQPGSALKDGYISINGFAHKYENDASALFGYNVDYYYKDNGADYEIVYIAASDKNEALVVDYKDILGYSNYTYSYDKNDKTKTVTIKPDTDVIFNGVAGLKLTDEDMVPKYGKVTFLDNDGKNGYEMVFIDSYEFMVVDSINTDKKVIKDSFAGITLDYSNADEVIVVNGTKDYDIERVYTGNLLMVKRSKDEGYYKLTIDVNKSQMNNVKITSTSGDTFTADGATYEIWDHIDEESKASIAIGEVVTLYSVGDMVVRVESGETSGEFGYLMAISEPEPLSTDISFRIIRADLSDMIYEKTKKIKIDGESLGDVTEIENALARGANYTVSRSDEFPLSQPVRYTVSNEGKLTSIDTLYFNNGYEDEEKSMRRVNIEKADGSGYETNFKYRSFNGGLYVNDNTFVASATNYMKIPTTDKSNFANFRKGAPSTESSTVMMDICMVDEDTKVAKFVFHYGSPDKTSDDKMMHVVMEKTTNLNADGEAVGSLKLGYFGNEYVYEVEEDAKEDFDALEVGDLVSLDMNGNKIRSIAKTASLSTLLEAPPEKGDRLGPQLSQSGKNTTKYPPYDGSRILYAGTALNIEAGKMLFTPSLVSDAGGIDVNYYQDGMNIGSAAVYKYSVVRGEPIVEKVGANEIVTYKENAENPSTLIVFVYSNTVREIFFVGE